VVPAWGNIAAGQAAYRSVPSSTHVCGSPKLQCVAQLVGEDASMRLQRRAENALRATGDRVMFSPTGRATRAQYDAALFPTCSNDVNQCLHAARLETEPTPTPSDEVVPFAPGEARARFISSHFRRSHEAQLLKWRMTQWSTAEIQKQREEVLQAVDTLVTAYCCAEGIDQAACEAYKRRLHGIATPTKRKRGQEEVRVEEIATLLWTSAAPVVLWHPQKGNVELCYLINAALRTDGGSGASVSPQFAPAVMLTCMMQLHTNATRRAGYHEHVRWPCGPRVGEKNGKSTQRDTVYRGSALPTEHKGFFDAMLASGQVYRVPMLLATSFELQSVNTTFLDNDRHGNQPRVRWTIKLDPEQRCRHANFIVKSETANEKELLFSAYSAFTVEKITWSTTPTHPTTPHEVVIRARPDNSVEPMDAPCAPWH
jgi:hypothetical protein